MEDIKDYLAKCKDICGNPNVVCGKRTDKNLCRACIEGNQLKLSDTEWEMILVTLEYSAQHVGVFIGKNAIGMLTIAGKIKEQLQHELDAEDGD